MALDNCLSGSGAAGCCTAKNPQKQAHATTVRRQSSRQFNKDHQQQGTAKDRGHPQLLSHAGQAICRQHARHEMAFRSSEGSAEVVRSLPRFSA